MPKEFQKAMNNTIQGLQGVDDILESFERVSHQPQENSRRSLNKIGQRRFCFKIE